MCGNFLVTGKNLAAGHALTNILRCSRFGPPFIAKPGSGNHRGAT